jgi:hypothetical protein
MIELEPRRDSMPKMMIAVLALGTTTMATGTMAFVRGGAAVSTLAEEAEVILAAVAVLAAVSGAVILATTAFAGGFRGGHFGRGF